jgi:hypothetical protein
VIGVKEPTSPARTRHEDRQRIEVDQRHRWIVSHISRAS